MSADDENYPILGEDYRYTADLLRQYSSDGRDDLFRAVCSNNLNIILDALDRCGRNEL